MTEPREPRKRTPKPKSPRNIMPERDAQQRATGFTEVATGYDSSLAVAEAERCLQCKKPLCVQGCPVGIDIPAFIDFVAEGDFGGGARRIKQDTNLPAICGRVCPQEKQCEEKCIVGKKNEPVSIGALERFVADWERDSGTVSVPDMAPPTGKKIAVIGSGPAGLTVAGELARRGHDVTIYEALHEPGGVLVYGIPEFRLPKDIVRQEVDSLREMGVKIELNILIGQSLTIDDLFNNGASAVFIGTGAGLPYFLDIPGENLNGVYTANEFLTRVNLMKAYRFPEYHTPVYLGKLVGVFGGGNTAMDAARTSKRLGPEVVKLMYRRSEQEMPARLEEVHHGKDEGVEFTTLVSPLEFVGGEDGWLQAVRVIHMELGEPDASGRRRPVPIEGSEELIELDTAIIAIGNGPNSLIPSTTPGLETSRHGTVIADESTGATKRRGVFAGGDIVTGAATVIQAMGAGKAAAVAIDEFVMEREDSEAQNRVESGLSGFFDSDASIRTDEERIALLYALGVRNPKELLDKPLPHWRSRVDELLDPTSIDMIPMQLSHAYVRYVRAAVQGMGVRAKSRLFRSKLTTTGLVHELRKLYTAATLRELGERFIVHDVDLLDDMRQSVRITIYDGGHRFVFDVVRINPESELIHSMVAEVVGIGQAKAVPFRASDGSIVALVEVVEGERIADSDMLSDEFYRKNWPWVVDLMAEQVALDDLLGVADNAESYYMDTDARRIVVRDCTELFQYNPVSDQMDTPVLTHVVMKSLPDDPESRRTTGMELLRRFEAAYVGAWDRIIDRWDPLYLCLSTSRELTESYGNQRHEELMRALEGVRRWNPVSHLTRLYETHLTELWGDVAQDHWAWRRSKRQV
jgi:glutamate synthase (NADPH) small chain